MAYGIVLQANKQLILSTSKGQSYKRKLLELSIMIQVQH